MKKISLLAAAVLLISSLLFCFSACSSDGSEIEDSTAAYSYVDSATPAKTSSEEVLHYFNELVNKIKSEKPAVSYNIEKSIPNDSIRVTKKGAEQSEETDSSLDAINDSAKGLKDLVLENIKRTRGNIAYGEENSDILFVKGESWASKLTENDIKYASMKEVGDNYYITIAFNDLTSAEAQEVLTKAFDLRDKDDILNSAELAKTNAYLKLNDYDVVYSGCTITATVNRFTDELTNVYYYKAANVTADMTGNGTLANYGDVSVMFKLEDKANFDITWENGYPTSPLDTSNAQ
ncbi:MAG: hypothetical protein Q4C21_06845 [Oscillospiraceae bacterium]|nr:hypothetical protein [Oscillospiraceae bacterium]